MSETKFCSFNIDELLSAMSLDNAEDLITMAKMAESAERYEDMCQFMRRRVDSFKDEEGHLKESLSTEERNLLSVAYKNVIGSRRSAWRTLSAEIMEAQSDPRQVDVLNKYKAQIEKELEDISLDVLDLLQNSLITDGNGSYTNSTEEQVFYLKMAGDYFRYLTESVYKDTYKTSTEEYYSRASEIAGSLAPTHPIRLGLALNYSVCHYEILKDEAKACALAKEAFDKAISQLDTLSEADYKDSTLIMQLLRDNLTLWTSNGDEDQVVVENLDEDP